MKKIYTLVAAFMVVGSVAQAQDTILYQGFNFDTFYDDTLQVTPPPQATTDMLWYNWDEDGLADGSTAGTRELEWFASWPFSDNDTLDMDLDGLNDDFVLASSSWTNQGETGTPTSNWLITRSMNLGAHDTLFWESAPYQTPLYLDGYEVRLSTTDNSDLSFTNLLFTGAEYTGSPGDDSLFTGYTYAPTGAFVHGFDGTYIEPGSDSARWRGRLRPFSVALDAYANMKVFIAIRHYSHDDNLFSIDNLMVRGTLPTVGINESNVDLAMNIYPNPASETVAVNYTLASSTAVTISVYDIAGKLILSQNKDVQSNGFHTETLNTADLNSGFYTVTVSTNAGRSTTKLIKK
jgi:hypothetical protein